MASEKTQASVSAPTTGNTPQKMDLADGMKKFGEYTTRDAEIDTLMEKLREEKNTNAANSTAVREALIREYPFIEHSLVKFEPKKSPGRPRKNTDDDDDSAAQLPEVSTSQASRVPVEA